MDELTELDLKFLPDWLKEAESRPAAKYADHPGEQEHRGDNRSRDRGPRPGQGGRGGPPGGDRSRRPGGPSRDSGGRAPGGPARDGRGGRDFRGNSGRDQREQREQRPQTAPAEPLDVQVEFLPDELTVGMIVREIKTKFHAYPLFTLARMFLDRPKSHRLKLTGAPGITLYQAGENGPISSDPRQLEKKLFELSRDEHYEEKTIEKEAPKGNFSNVAKCKLSGTLLGPTNHHAYQSSLRRLFEERFSRRMKFEEYRREIEIVTDPAAVEAWKEQASRSHVFVTKKEETPVELTSLADAQKHFKETYQPNILRSGQTLEVNGMLGRDTPDQRLFMAIRNAWETENKFPSHVAGNLRSKFSQEGLHTFKHRKRIIFVSTVRPNEFTGDMSSLSAGVAGILNWVNEHPNGTRKSLAEAVLPTGVTEEELNKAKSLLATDLRWLVHAGHVIEFQNGTLDLPLPAKPKEEPKPKAHSGAGSGTKAPKAADAVPETVEVLAEEIEPEKVIEESPEAVVVSEIAPAPIAEEIPKEEPVMEAESVVVPEAEEGAVEITSAEPVATEETSPEEEPVSDEPELEKVSAESGRESTN